MAKPISTARGLARLLESHVEDAPNTLSVKLNGSTYNVLNGALYVGSLAGDDYAAVVIGSQTIFLEIDHRSTSRAAKVISEPSPEVVSKIAKALVPEPEPPAEVVAANQALASLPKLPRGWRYSLDAKGNLTVVEADGGNSGDAEATPAPKTRAPRGTAVPKPTKPTIVKGLKLVRNKTNVAHTVTAVDTSTGFVVLKPEDGSEDYRTKALRGNGSTAPVPVFWANWAEAK